jgi:hypothetical protein
MQVFIEFCCVLMFGSLRGTIGVVWWLRFWGGAVCVGGYAWMRCCRLSQQWLQEGMKSCASSEMMCKGLYCSSRCDQC